MNTHQLAEAAQINDTKRLDWLESQYHCVIKTYSNHLKVLHKITAFNETSLRGAIDAAMSQTKEKGK